MVDSDKNHMDNTAHEYAEQGILRQVAWHVYATLVIAGLRASVQSVLWTETVQWAQTSNSGGGGDHSNLYEL